MLPKYTFALGGTDKIKAFVDFVEGQQQVRETILKKISNETNYNIGEDTTFQHERDVIKKRGES